MKTRFIVITMVICLILSMSACSYSDDDCPQFNENIVGTWELEAVKLNGITHVESKFLDMYDYAFTFSTDGKATATVMGISYSTTYEIKDGWIVFGETALGAVKLKVADGKLEMTLSAIGGGLVFAKQTTDSNE